jgi:Uma2 family endonuclease
MIQTVKKTYSFEEYLNYNDGTELQYELVNGELISMPTASGIHALIMVFLYDIFKQQINYLKQKWAVMPGNIGVRTDEKKSRIPDLVILNKQQVEELKEMAVAVLQTPPILAVEIVSPGHADDDYRYKRSEYAVKGIPEYWIVDPIAKKVSVLVLVSGFYDLTEFTESQQIISPTFPNLNLTANQVLLC